MQYNVPSKGSYVAAAFNIHVAFGHSNDVIRSCTEITSATEVAPWKLVHVLGSMGDHISQKWYEFTTGDQEIDRFGWVYRLVIENVDGCNWNNRLVVEIVDRYGWVYRFLIENDGRYVQKAIGN